MAALPLSYASFVQGFARVAADGTAHDELAWKRQKVVAHAAGIAPAPEKNGVPQKPPNVDRVPMIRYAMGADDSLYLQSGIGMLFRSQGVDPAKELPLAPAALYSSEAVNALRKSLLAQQIDHATSLADTANANKAAYVRTLNEVFYDQYKYMPNRLDLDAPDEQIVNALQGLQRQLAPGELLKQSVTDKENQELVRRRDELVRLHKAKEDEANKLSADLATLKDDQYDLLEALGRETAEVTTAKAALVDANKQLTEGLREIDRVQDEARAAARTQAEEKRLLDEKLKVLNALQEQTEAKRLAAVSDAEAKQAALTASRDELADANAELLRARSDITTTTAELKALEQNLETVSREQTERNKELAASLENLQVIQEKTQVALKGADDLTQQVQDQLVATSGRVRALNSEVDTQKSKVAALEAAKETAERNLQTEREEKLAAEENVKAATARLQDVEKAQQAAAAEAARTDPKFVDLRKWQQSRLEKPRETPGLLQRLNPFARPKEAEGTSTSSLVGYALARGLCGHRGPHEAPSDAPTDALLTYAVPSGIVHALARTKHLRVPDSFAPPPPPSDAPDPFVQGEVDAALAGDFAIDAAQPGTSAVRPARAVRWQPRGPHAEALATAAALEHAAARCTQLADAGGLSERAQARLRDMATTFKLHQLDSMYEVSCAIESGEELPLQPEAPMVTRPVAHLRGALHYAHDAGHHPAPPTAAVDEGARWTASDQRAHSTFRATAEGNVYLAPSTERLGYEPMPTGVVSTAPAEPPVRPLGPDGFRGSILDAMRDLVHWGLYYYNRPSESDIARLRKVQEQLAIGESDEASPAERRGGVWNEFWRDMSITTDRVWVFVRTMSGLIGEDASSLVATADDASLAAAREQKERDREIAEKVATFQTKIVDSLVAGMVRESKLQLDVHRPPDAAAADAASRLVVINADTAKQINDLASGESGRPFFEANVALRNLTDRKDLNQKPLGEIVQEVTKVASVLKTALTNSAAALRPPGTTLAELSLPRNSYFVKLREDTVAAIRSAFDKLAHELAHAGVRQLRLFELVEGCDHLLSSRFAEFVGHVLIQNRSSTGVSALYASRTQLTVNASQAYVALRRLVSHAAHYTSHARAPNFDADDATTLQKQRDAYFSQQHTATCIAQPRAAPPVQLRITNRLPGSFAAPGGGGSFSYNLTG